MLNCMYYKPINCRVYEAHLLYMSLLKTVKQFANIFSVYRKSYKFIYIHIYSEAITCNYNVTCIIMEIN